MDVVLVEVVACSLAVMDIYVVLFYASFYSNSYGVSETDLYWFLREKVKFGLELLYQAMIRI